MNAPISRCGERRMPPLPGRGRIGAAAVLLLLTAAGSAGAAPVRFEVQAALQSKSAAQAGSGFALQAKLAPVERRLEGGGFAVAAVAAPTGTCGGGDLIFADGFEQRMMARSSGK